MSVALVSLADLAKDSATAERAVSSLNSATIKLSDSLSTVTRASQGATNAARRQSDNVVSLDAAYRQTSASAIGAATATNKLGSEAKLSGSQVAVLASNMIDLVSGLASGTQPLAATLKQVIGLAGGLGQAFGALGAGAGGATGAARGLGSAMMAAAGGPWTIALTAAGAAAYTLWQYEKAAGEATDDQRTAATSAAAAVNAYRDAALGAASASDKSAQAALRNAAAQRVQAVQAHDTAAAQMKVAQAQLAVLATERTKTVNSIDSSYMGEGSAPASAGYLRLNSLQTLKAGAEFKAQKDIVDSTAKVIAEGDNIVNSSSQNFIKSLKNQQEELGKTNAQLIIMRAQREALRAPDAAAAATIMSEARALADKTQAQEASEKAAAQRADAAREQAQKYQQLVDGAVSIADALRRETSEIALNSEQLKAREVRVAAAKAPTEALRLEILAEGRAWQAATALRKEATDRAAEIQSATANLSVAPAIDFAAIDLSNIEVALDALQAIDAQANRVSKSLTEAFGRVGSALGGLTKAMTAHAVEMKTINKLEQAGNLSGEAATRQRGIAEVRAYGDMAQAAKGFFKEKSVGYQVIGAAEKTFRAIEFAMSVKAMVMDAAETGSKIAQSAMRGAAYASEAIAMAFKSIPPPFNFAVAAAVGAALVAAGVKMFGGGGSGSGAVPGATDAKDRQESQGTGSVLGDSKAKSDSLAKALDQQLKNQNKDLEYSNQMVASLRAIQSNIGVVASLLARQLGLSTGVFDTSGLQLGTSGKPATLANLGFGKTTTNSLQDLGLQFGAETLGSIVANGVDGATYQQVLSQTKKKAFGITYSNKTSVDTTTGALDGDLTAEINRLIGSLREGVLEGAKALELDSAAAIDAVVVNLGKISFKDLTGAQIEEQLNAVFGKLADDLAVAAVPALTAFQKVGEGAFETLARVAREYEVVDVAFASIGRTFGALGVDSLAARDHLIEAAGGMDAFTEQVSFYAENFLSEAERLKPVQDSVAKELQRLAEQYGDADIATIKTKDQFKALVQGINTTDSAGGDLFAALMALAPAFAKMADAVGDTSVAVDASAIADRRKSIQDEIDKLTLEPAELIKRQRAEEMAATIALDASLGPLLQQFYDLSDAADAAAAATKLANDRRALEIQLMEARGDTAGAQAAKRADDLAAIDDPVQRATQQAIYAAQDAAAAVTSARDVLTKAYQRESAALQATSDKFKAFAVNLAKFRDSLDAGPLAQLSPGDQYQASRSAFEQTAALARLGNEDALGSLQSVSEAYLGVSRSAAATAVDYQRDLASVKIAVEAAGETADRTASVADQQLAALNASVSGLIVINDSVISVQAAILALRGAMSSPALSAGAGSVAAGGGAGGGHPMVPGGLGSDQSSNEAAKDGKYAPNDSYDPDFHDALRKTLNENLAKEAAMTPEEKAARDARVAAEGLAFLDSVWGGYPGAYNEHNMKMFKGFARGGAFTNGVVLHPTAFNLAQMGEAGPEAIMPLTMGPNGLGVRAAGGSSDAKELRDLKAEVANLNVALMAIAENTGATARMQRRWDGDGLPAERNVA